MEIVAVGLSHRTAPLELRERLAASPEDLAHRLEALSGLPAVREAVLLSTCNRVEVYAAVADPGPAVASIRGLLQASAPIDLGPHLYVYEGAEAARHIFRVAASLDSMVLGEPQILGQVKDAYEAARGRGLTGPILHRCFHRAFQVAKRVRSETGIGRAAVSMAAVAVDLARTIFEELSDRRVLLVGAGEMAQLAARHLSAAGVSQILVANRSRERAEQIAREVRGRAHAIEELGPLLEVADIVVTSTAAAHFLLNVAEAKRVMKARKHRPLFLIDLAVPRDVDPRVGDLDNVYLYDVDDLQQVAERNRAERSREAADAELTIERESQAFIAWMRSLDVVPTVIALRQRFASVAREETERTLAAIGPLTEAQRRAVERLGDSIVNKLLHAPLTQLKRHGADDEPDLAAAARRLFDLDASSGPVEPQAAETRPARPVPAEAPKP